MLFKRRSVQCYLSMSLTLGQKDKDGGSECRTLKSQAHGFAWLTLQQSFPATRSSVLNSFSRPKVPIWRADSSRIQCFVLQVASIHLAPSCLSGLEPLDAFCFLPGNNFVASILNQSWPFTAYMNKTSGSRPGFRLDTNLCLPWIQLGATSSAQVIPQA